jgi:hypothetical protein
MSLDVISFVIWTGTCGGMRNRSIGQLEALKMLFKSARRNGVVTEDPTEFVGTARREGHPRLNAARFHCWNFEGS